MTIKTTFREAVELADMTLVDGMGVLAYANADLMYSDDVDFPQSMQVLPGKVIRINDKGIAKFKSLDGEQHTAQFYMQRPVRAEDFQNRRTHKGGRNA